MYKNGTLNKLYYYFNAYLIVNSEIPLLAIPTPLMLYLWTEMVSIEPYCP